MKKHITSIAVLFFLLPFTIHTANAQQVCTNQQIMDLTMQQGRRDSLTQDINTLDADIDRMEINVVDTAYFAAYQCSGQEYTDVLAILSTAETLLETADNYLHDYNGTHATKQLEYANKALTDANNALDYANEHQDANVCSFVANYTSQASQKLDNGINMYLNAEGAAFGFVGQSGVFVPGAQYYIVHAQSEISNCS